MIRIERWIKFSSALLLLASGIVPSAMATTTGISLVSAPPDLPEGAVVQVPAIVAIDGVLLQNPTHSIVTNTALWALPLPGASYVSSCPDCGSIIARCGGGFEPVAPHLISFSHPFELPNSFSNPLLRMTTTNDDAANVYLNGNFIGRAQTCCGPRPGEKNTVLESADASFFRPGTNEILYELENFNAPCPLSMAYVVTISFEGLIEVVLIDIKPGSDPNSINPRSRGLIPVGILTTSIADGDALDFDAGEIDSLSLAFGPNAAGIAHAQGHIEDLDGDGDLDMVAHFRTQDTGIACGDTEATLTGETLGGKQFEGMDAVRTVGCR